MAGQLAAYGYKITGRPYIFVINVGDIELAVYLVPKDRLSILLEFRREYGKSNL